MNSTEKEISYTATNSYSTLNTLSNQTKNIWFVCHGMGYLSRYFLRYFSSLSPEENYVIAPQAQSKYYIAPKMKHVGASWLTKENTLKETENVMRYFDAIFNTEKITPDKNLMLLGYSQGVSVVMRYMAKRQLSCQRLIIHSGGIPKELTPKDFEYLNLKTKVNLVYGTQDEYLDHNRIEQEELKAKALFGDRLSLHPFEGKHEVNSSLIKVFSE
ncbi:esterase [Mangrovimonas yunxiaonensis]|uniref:Esterase n=1 Tax=Mangrovimonas yunxiaonensis TaxID=1197477 RepID=A0A084THJ0_9FLAO|nr:esterase [Mangrovimonas yunxiaonensis]KFB00176.1 esterase [Mangrovimonas yunxiaonensis]GGH42350.1 esterase [Mangrovimonas yunxiaonensis]